MLEEIMTDEEPQSSKKMLENALSEDASDKDQKYKFLKPGKGTGPKKGANVAVFDRKTAAKEIINFWKNELAKAAEAEVAKNR
jgi:hypothetical protein